MLDEAHPKATGVNFHNVLGEAPEDIDAVQNPVTNLGGLFRSYRTKRNAADYNLSQRYRLLIPLLK
jgi:hypothetical protein